MSKLGSLKFPEIFWKKTSSTDFTITAYTDALNSA